MEWSKASYGKTASKSGGGKLDAVGSKGNRGITSTAGVTKSSVSRVKGGIDTPTTKGNKGVTIDRGFKSSKPPKD